MGADRSRPDTRTLLGFAAIVVFAGLNFVAVRFSNRELQPFWGATFRFAIASALLLVVVAAAKVPLPRGASLKAALIFGLTNFAASYALAYWGLVFVPAGTGAVIFSMLPLATLFVAAGVGLEKVQVRAVAGGVIALSGTAILFQEQLRADLPLAAMLAVAASMLFGAVSGVVLKRAPKSHPVATNAVGMTVGTPVLAALSLLFGEAQRLPSSEATWAAVTWLVLSTIGLFVLYVWVLSRWTASATAYSIVLAPLVTITAASILAGEVVTLVFVAGSAVVIAGVYLGALLKTPARKA